MNHRRSLIVAVGLLLVLVAGAVAEESKFSLSKYVPFMGKDSSTAKSSSVRSNTTSQRAATAKKTDQKSNGSRPKKSAQPSTWEKFTSGTKSTFSKLNPWSSDKSKTKKTASTKTDRPKTVSDFIKQPRPE